MKISTRNYRSSEKGLQRKSKTFQIYSIKCISGTWKLIEEIIISIDKLNFQINRINWKFLFHQMFHQVY